MTPLLDAASKALTSATGPDRVACFVVLYVNCPSGLLNFDTFIYLPLQNYPDRGLGGFLERVGRWAYVHE